MGKGFYLSKQKSDRYLSLFLNTLGRLSLCHSNEFWALSQASAARSGESSRVLSKPNAAGIRPTRRCRPLGNVPFTKVMSNIGELFFFKSQTFLLENYLTTQQQNNL